jgi:uncharacterized membrane protein YhaH (DUF805 family)
MIMAFCVNCGSKLDEDAKFCARCGTRQDAGAAVPAAPAQSSGAGIAGVMPPPAVESQPAFQQPVYVPPQVVQQPYASPVSSGPSAWQYFVRAFEKQSVFSGRARRSEFWFFTLFTCIIQFGVAILVSLAQQYLYDGESNLIVFFINCAMPSFLAYAVTFMPGLAVAIRRMHDCGKSGWYLLIPVYGWIVLPCTAGTPGPNQYGPDPKQNGN